MTVHVIVPCIAVLQHSLHLNHLENEQVTVSETDKEFRVTGRRVHALQEALQSLGREGGIEECEGEKQADIHTMYMYISSMQACVSVCTHC